MRVLWLGDTQPPPLGWSAILVGRQWRHLMQGRGKEERVEGMQARPQDQKRVEEAIKTENQVHGFPGQKAE